MQVESAEKITKISLLIPAIRPSEMTKLCNATHIRGALVL